MVSRDQKTGIRTTTLIVRQLLLGAAKLVECPFLAAKENQMLVTIVSTIRNSLLFINLLFSGDYQKQTMWISCPKS